MTVRGACATCLLALVVSEAGCTALADRDVTYRPCVPVSGSHYVDDFDGNYQDVLDRCWAPERAPAGSRIFTLAGDLVMRPIRGRVWSKATRADEQPLALFRKMRGDFLIVTRTEVASTIQSDHCLINEEAAGLVVRRAQPFAWATLLVHPYFDPMTSIEEACKDEATNPPTAVALANTFGFGEAKTKAVPGVGADAESEAPAPARRPTTRSVRARDAEDTQPPSGKTNRESAPSQPSSTGVSLLSSTTIQVKCPSTPRSSPVTAAADAVTPTSRVSVVT